MPGGLQLPVGVNGSGGVAVIDGSAQDDKLVRMALSDNGSENAFQQGIGLGQFLIFRVNDAATRIVILQRIREIFAAFLAEERFRLREETLKFTEGKEGELVLEFRYLSLRADQERTFSSTITPAGFALR